MNINNLGAALSLIFISKVIYDFIQIYKASPSRLLLEITSR